MLRAPRPASARRIPSRTTRAAVATATATLVATALVACCVSDGYVFVPTTIDGRPTIWEPDPSHDTDDVVPVDDVDNAVRHARTRIIVSCAESAGHAIIRIDDERDGGRR